MGKYIKHTKEKLEEAVKNSYSFAGVCRYLYVNLAGGNQTHIKNRIVFYNIDYSHFTGKLWSKGKILNKQRLHAKDLLIVSNTERRTDAYKLKRALIEIGRECICEQCGIGEIYNNKPITLQIDHIDGNWQNNLEQNIRFLCPNCHSQTLNHGSKKFKKRKNIREKKEPKINKGRLHLRKFEITKQELADLVWRMSTSKVAKLFDVSDKAIEKRCKLLSVDKPPRGYWTKHKSE